MHIDIRLGNRSDATEISRLHTALGHPTTAKELLARWDDWEATGNTVLVAYVNDQSIAGIATLHKMFVLHRPKPVGRITSLVVDVPFRNQGVGRALVASAENTLASSGCGLLEVTSHARHTDIYDFYQHLGYERTGVRFAKTLFVN